MKITFLILTIFHALLHLLGFVKAFHLKEVKGLTLPISKTQGLLWLVASLLFLLFGFSYFIYSSYTGFVGLSAVVLSQLLIILFWKDARFGSILNAVILMVSICSIGYYQFQKQIQQETFQILGENKSIEEKILTEKDLTPLPAPVQKWLRRSGTIGKPFIQVGRVTQTAEMQMKPGQENWMKAEAVQYTTINIPSFIWSANASMNSLLSFQGRDKFENGKGEMLIKLNSLLNIVNEHGDKLDEGTLQRYLGEMVWFPSLALSPYVSWEVINDSTAKASFSYKGKKVSGTFQFNAKGDITQFSALRYKGNDVAARRYEWIMNILDYKSFEGIRVPSKLTSTWKLEEGDWTWLKLEVTNLQYNQNALREFQ